MSDVFFKDASNNEYPVMDGDLLLSYYGNWSASLMLSRADQVPSGKVTLSWFGAVFQGHIIRSGENEGRVSCMIAGGGGGLSKKVPAKMYDYSLQLQLPLREILASVGETLSSTSTQSILTKQLQNWTRMNQDADELINSLSDQVKAVWRILPDGSLFIGNDTWTTQDAFDYTLISQDPVCSFAKLSVTSVDLMPGKRFPIDRQHPDISNRKIACAQYIVTPTNSRATVWFADEDGPVIDDPLHAGLTALVKQTMRYVDYHPAYSAKVILQRANGTLDVAPDDSRLPPMTSVPVRVPVPGMKIKVDAGSRVVILFENGDPTRYSAHLYESGSGGKKIARVDDEVDCGKLIFTAVANGVLTGTYTPPSASSAPPNLPIPFSLGVEISLKGIITTGWPQLEVGANKTWP